MGGRIERMVGSGFWSTGILVDHRDGKWSATVEYSDAASAGADSADRRKITTEGTLGTRYLVADGTDVDGLTAVVDVAKADAERLGIGWQNMEAIPMPSILAAFEVAAENYPVRYPADWRVRLNEQARRVGWRPFYSAPDTTTR
jgi:hypothetical protein